MAIKNYVIILIEGRSRYPMVQVNEVYEEHWVNTFADLSDDIISEITNWCHENKCGYRTSYNQFKFQNEKQLVKFLLKWGN